MKTATVRDLRYDFPKIELCFACPALMNPSADFSANAQAQGACVMQPRSAERQRALSWEPRITPDPRPITNPVGVPSKRSTLWPRILFATPLTGPRRGPPSESNNAHLSPGEAAARLLLGCMTGPRRGPQAPMRLMDPANYQAQGACAPFSAFVFGPNAAVPYQTDQRITHGPREWRQQSGHLAPPR